MPDRWMTYEEAGELFGLSAEAVRKRARRLHWRIENKGNEPNAKARVLVPDGAELRPPGQPTGRPAGDRPDELLVELRRRAEGAEARAEATEGRARQLAGELATQHERAGRAEGERDAARAEAVALRDDVARERERGDAALARALVAEAKLEAGSLVERAAKAWRASLGRLRRL